MTRPNPSTFIVGAGPVAASLAMSLRRGGVPVLGLWARRAAAARQAAQTAGVAAFSSAPPDLLLDAQVVILAVRDDAIATVAQMLLTTGLISPRHVLLHNAGAIAAHDALAPAVGKVAGLGTLHPLRAIVRPAPGDAASLLLRGTTFGIEGDDAGLSAARALVAAMGGVPLELGAASMAGYHAAAALASNYVVALLSTAAEVLAGPGNDPSAALAALLPLTQGAIANLGSHGLPAGLTGAVRRGDPATVERHLQALTATPDALAAYRLLGRRAVDLAAALPDDQRPAPAALERLRALLA